MEKDTKDIKFQEEISKILGEYRLSFECPHCHKEINETHFGEGERTFQLINEKVRIMVEKEVDSQKNLHKKQWLEQIEESKKYEEFVGFIKLKVENEKQTKIIEELRRNSQEKELNYTRDLAEKTSFGEIKKLSWFKDLERKLDEFQKENEELKIGNQPEIQTLRKIIEELNVKLSGAYSSDKIERLTRFKELKIELEESKKQIELLKDQAQPEIKSLKKSLEDKNKSIEELKENIANLQSSDAVEKLGRVKDLKEQVNNFQKENEELKERNRDLVISKNKDSQRKGAEFEQWFFEELIKIFDGRDNIKDVSKGQSGIGKRADFLQEVLTETEPKKVVGKIVYETKNTEKWDSNWVTKLEKDMQTHGAEFGFIVATCENDKIIRLAESVDPRKKIYVSDGNSNLFLVVKIVRELLINRHNFMKMGDSTEKEQKLKKTEDWVNSKLPGYIMNLAKQLDNQENAVKTIIDKAEKIKKFKDEIYRLTMNNIISELKECLEYK